MHFLASLGLLITLLHFFTPLFFFPPNKMFWFSSTSFFFSPLLASLKYAAMATGCKSEFPASSLLSLGSEFLTTPPQNRHTRAEPCLALPRTPQTPKQTQQAPPSLLPDQTAPFGAGIFGSSIGVECGPWRRDRS